MTYDNGEEATLGNKINPALLYEPPTVSWESANQKKFYTVCMIGKYTSVAELSI